MVHDPDHAPGALWISSDGYGEPSCSCCCRWGFAWALTYSRSRLDGFGGGAQLIDLGARRSIAWTDCEHWLACGLGGDDDERVAG